MEVSTLPDRAGAQVGVIRRTRRQSPRRQAVDRRRGRRSSLSLVIWGLCCKCQSMQAVKC